MTQLANAVEIVAAAWSNEAFRRVILTGTHQQVVVMTIPPGAEIGDETHPDTDQALAFVDGHGEGEARRESADVGPNELVFVQRRDAPQLREHGRAAIRLITIYAPPEHAPGTVHLTKAEADAEGH